MCLVPHARNPEDRTMADAETPALMPIEADIRHLDGAVAELHVISDHVITAEIRIPGPA